MIVLYVCYNKTIIYFNFEINQYNANYVLLKGYMKYWDY